MPLFMGTLSAAPTQIDTTSTGEKTLKTHLALAAVPSSGYDTPVTPELSQHPPTISLEKAASSAKADTDWVPSGGRKLETGFSIVLENVAGGFVRPNVLDVKLGARLWDDDAPLSKRARLDEVSKSTTSSSLGFRIAGMKVWVGEGSNQTEEEVLVTIDGHIPSDAPDEVKSKMKIVEAEGYRRFDKFYGRAFNDRNIVQAIQSYLASAKAGKKDSSKLVARRLAAGLREIQSMLEKEESRMYSASILIIYEGDPEAFEQALAEEDLKKGSESPRAEGNLELDDEVEIMELDTLQQLNPTVVSGGSVTLTFPTGDVPAVEEVPGLGLGEDEEEEPSKVLDMRLIDFAHACWTPGEGPDENALQGIRSLARILEEFSGT